MVKYTKKGKSQYARKLRRQQKYGTYKRPTLMTYKKGKGTGKKRYVTPVFRNPFKNDYQLVQLCYYDNITLNPNPDSIGSGGSNAWSFSYNSLFDPDVTSVGHQPMYLDNYVAIYENYKVSFAKITCTVVNHFVNTTTANSSGVTTTQPNYSYKLGIIRDADITDTGASFKNLLEQDAKNVNWRYVAPQLNGYLPKISQKCAPHKTAGVSYDDDTLSSIMSGNPSKNIKGTIVITSADGVTDPPSVSLAVKINYYIKFFNRKNAQSQN